ncbi:hypothetical protein [Modestobacter altitudinis]|uniref:hypothetical protein n=1 Tax=Modestobacter altitudinis TaxID=2213158 RepID=UPI00110CA7B5|nr:hypothetical protein [Modestobacter altitudinis]
MSPARRRLADGRGGAAARQLRSLWAGLALGTMVAAAAALAGVPAVALAALVVAASVDAVLPTSGIAGSRPAEIVQHALGRSTRLVVRLLVLVLVLATLAAQDRAAAVIRLVVAAAVLLVAAVAATDAVAWSLQGMRRHPVARGIDGLQQHAAHPLPSRLLVTLVPELLLVTCVAWAADRVGIALALCAVSVAAAGAGAAVWAGSMWRGRADRPRRLRLIQRLLVEAPPEVVLYFGDGEKSVHEVNTWLPTLERLPRSVMVVARSRAAFLALPPTTVPVVCVPAAADMVALPWAGVRVALFVSNIGNNIHLLRTPGLRTAFIGHGDSDKSASSNPFSKVYDEIWVAGPAGRRRYLQADVGVRPEALVEVGRPQLELVHDRSGLADRVPTLLYAPTWEGWNDDQAYASVLTHAEAIVDAVLASPVPVRLLYRPHPYAGRRDARLAAVHRRIVARLTAANAAAGSAAPTVLAATTRTAVADSAAEEELRAVQRGEELLDAGPRGLHRVVEPGGAPLTSCFNVASALITDVSSVLTDFLAADRPVAVCDPRGQDRAAFVARYPSAAAGLVLPPGAGGIEELLQVLTGVRDDAHRCAREATRRELLGDPGIRALDRMAAAVEALGGRSAAARGTVGRPG